MTSKGGCVSAVYMLPRLVSTPPLDSDSGNIPSPPSHTGMQSLRSLGCCCCPCGAAWVDKVIGEGASWGGTRRGVTARWAISSKQLGHTCSIDFVTPTREKSGGEMEGNKDRYEGIDVRGRYLR